MSVQDDWANQSEHFLGIFVGLESEGMSGGSFTGGYCCRAAVVIFPSHGERGLQ